jgi:hypothetical protein
MLVDQARGMGEVVGWCEKVEGEAVRVNILA